LVQAAREAFGVNPAADSGDPQEIPAIVQEAVSICSNAHTIWQRSQPALRAHIRGFSLDLLGVAIDQVIQLDRAFHDYRQCEIEVADAAARLASATARGALLAQQAHSLIEMVGGADLIEGPALESDGAEAQAVIAALDHAVSVGTALAQSAVPVVKQRCLLFNLDQAYVLALKTTVSELETLARTAAGVALVTEGKRKARDIASFLRPLLENMVEAFSVANRLEGSIGILRSQTHGASAGRKPDSSKARSAGDARAYATTAVAPAPMRAATLVVSREVARRKA
jgi:hypothetical protein